MKTQELILKYDTIILYGSQKKQTPTKPKNDFC